jgi:uncharacterized protein YbjT (DUF2867 family)
MVEFFKNMKTALVFGATGLTGKFLLNELLVRNEYNKVLVFVRKRLKLTHPALEIIHFETEQLEEIKAMIKGDDLYCCVGTTIKKAGSQKKFREVDYELPVKLAQIAAENKVSCMAVISSLGAATRTHNFYLRTKGEMEEKILSMHIGRVVLARPSMLLGPREESRPAERIGKVAVNLLKPLLRGKLEKYQGIHVEVLARALVNLVNAPSLPKHVFESDELQKWGKA